MKLSLRRRHALVQVLTTTALVVTLAATLLTQFQGTSERITAATESAMLERLRAEVRGGGVQTAQLLAENLVNPLYALDMDAIQQLLFIALKQPGVRYIYVLDQDDRLVHDGNVLIPLFGERLNDNFAKPQPDIRQVQVQSDAEQLDVSVPIQTGSTYLGRVRLGLSLANVYADVEEVRLQLEDIAAASQDLNLRTIYAVTAIFAGIGIGIAFLISGRLTKPIQALAAGVERISRGDLDTPVSGFGDDELGRLAREFNRMRGALKESGLRLEEHIEELARQAEERRELNVRLLQVEKMDAIGRLAGGVAHDFNNHLTIIRGNAELLSWSRLKSVERESVDTILASTTSAAALTGQLLAFARQGALEHEAMEIDRLLEEVLRMLSRSIDKRIDITTDLRTPGEFVHGDRAQLQSIFLNLGLNARDAIQGQGRIHVRTGAIVLQEGSLMAQEMAPDLMPGDYVKISVQDSGGGISAEDVENIFEPFYTTKPVGMGTGLGLAAAYGAAHAHAGHITVHSRPGETTFNVFLPCSAAPEETSAEVSAGPAEHEHGTVIVVDAIHEVATVHARMLASMGYQTRIYRTGDEAVGALFEENHEVKAIILDMASACGDYELTFAQIRASVPDLPVLLLSTFPLGSSDRSFGRHSLMVVKPVTHEELARCLSKLAPETHLPTEAL
ncbi:MAG: ATP-binding protein [Pseudomonadota bacterium]